MQSNRFRFRILLNSQNQHLALGGMNGSYPVTCPETSIGRPDGSALRLEHSRRTFREAALFPSLGFLIAC
jgi:hypothetical protein